MDIVPFQSTTTKEIREAAKLKKTKDTVYDLIIDEIYQSDAEKKKLMRKKYAEILNDCLFKVTEKYNSYIRRGSKNGYGKIYYTVPRSVIGLEKLYSVEDCLVYILVNLRRRNFDTYYVPPNRIMVLWVNPDVEAEHLMNTEILNKEYQRTVAKFGELGIEAEEEPKKEQPRERSEASDFRRGEENQKRSRSVETPKPRRKKLDLLLGHP